MPNFSSAILPEVVQEETTFQVALNNAISTAICLNNLHACNGIIQLVYAWAALGRG